MAEFKVGDNVQLRAGGPIMTIVEISAGGCLCQWFNDKKVESFYFVADALAKVEGHGTVKGTGGRDTSGF